MKKSMLYVSLIVGIVSCAKGPVSLEPAVQLQANDEEKKREENPIIDDGDFRKDRKRENHSDDKPTSTITVLVDDVGKYLEQADAPKRAGRLKFTTDSPLKVKEGEEWIEATYSYSYNGFRLKYVLTGKLRDGKRNKNEIKVSELAQVEIKYTDSLLASKGLTENDVPGLIDQLYKPENKVQCHGSVIPGGEMLSFSEPMVKLMILGGKARQPLLKRLGDQRVCNEVALILGAIGDEATVPALIAVYPDIDIKAKEKAGNVKYEERLNVICMTFSLTYLTGQPIGRSRWGADYNPENRRRWTEWWDKEKATFKVPISKPNHTWVPNYPILSEEWAKKSRDWFVNEPK